MDTDLEACRETLGFSQKVWRSMTETLRAGNDELQGNKHHLLPKVWDLAILARNLLAAKEKAQNLAAYGSRTCYGVALRLTAPPGRKDLRPKSEDY